MSAETCLISHPCALFLYSPSPQSRKSRLKRRDTRLKQKPKMSSCACTTARQAVQPVPASSDKNDNALCHARDTKQVFLRKNSGLGKSYVFSRVHTFYRLDYNNKKPDNTDHYNKPYGF
ncbi:hypothetical protein [Enterobacter hormaechei]|uniref:hypothetical protein n=1 Tax=Enterobacter hormaechei TaxID=158836 RepID=UPI000F822938|nr:hypothetical protein [Enterobacter hormaechei]MEA3806202.1 hypothetical protein [Enterobacter hormaechei]MEA3815329.1 hypothetical protein [Enterobacter hormaechei]QLO97720.1 hypothetical protein HV047_08580 [Enterobacter hormaechei]RTN57917.1 hypothetical protein EKN91_00960 [Enterobacter hormaechei]HCU2527449.1 hypothetical protein [Enterobacter hormaechei]